MSLIYAYQSRGLQKDITILDADGDTITPGSSDKIRAIIGRLGETAKLTVSSDAATSNGSSFTKGATNRLRLDASDLAAIDPGTYTLFIDYFDADDGAGGEWKTVDRQVMQIEDT
jgi:hypothetical protein